ncbi:hypothetical protein [Parvibaculum sp.]|uniref:hypothetical protein n=1 Tax=Parvibaculum sp. TaxID=2024848 RepID=UPI001B2BF4A6|nr:hypothetical protein [Parvibaculum sp.]MBO6633463.1 hypothetical protein [Parvibaculum sp.]MBO6677823.1 hypothetical protein [Parvibaculum sp.]MBO6684159.1 hypothetical protein [Parvibaculum sp.]MBO6903542.1 hypothetical protein [Parvibaculum sp.]
MKRMFALFLLLAGSLIAPGTAFAQEAANYDACLALVERDADAALGMARTLKLRGGEEEAGGMHCEALALMQMDRPAEAGSAFFDLAERMLRADDALRSEIYAQAGDAWAIAGASKLAVKAYDNAIARMPEDPTYYAGRARVKAIAEDWEGVRDDAAEALALDPNYPEPMLLRSAANRKLGYPRASLVDANHAVELNPHSLDALLERGLVHNALDDKASAWNDWSTLLRYAEETGRLEHPAAVAAKTYLAK